MAEPKKQKRKEKRPEIEAPYIPEFEIPDPPVPNRAFTEMSLGNFGAEHESGTSDALGNFDTSNKD